MCVSGNEMSGIEMAVYTVKIIFLFSLRIIKMRIFPGLGELCGEKVLMAFDTAAVINIFPGNFKPSAVFPVE